MRIVPAVRFPFLTGALAAYSEVPRCADRFSRAAVPVAGADRQLDSLLLALAELDAGFAGVLMVVDEINDITGATA